MRVPTTIARLLVDAADDNADGIALRDQGVSVTWEQAEHRAGRLAGALAAAGVGPGDRVGVHYRKSADAFLAMHAVVRSGAIAVPLDPTAHHDYLATVVSQSGCAVLMTHGACARTARSIAASGAIDTVIGLDVADGADLDERSHPDDRNHATRWVGPDAIDSCAGRPPIAVDPEAASYIITTSGSTGRPKGICHTHASAAAHIAFMLDAYDLQRADRISDIAPNHFDISTLALWVAPAVGGTVVVVPEPYQMLPASLAQLVEDEAISIWYSVPYLLTQLNARGDLDAHDLSALRWVLFGGEVFPPRTLAELMTRVPGARFSNVFGPAEVNACLIHHLSDAPVDDAVIPAGRPFGDTTVRLVDLDDTHEFGEAGDQGNVGTAGSEPDVGEIGEIWVRSGTMMSGYWERDDLTSAAVVEDRSGRWYRTGDLGWRRGDGEIVFVGRRDHQVKIRGFRVELEAIEAVLEDLDGIRNAVATVHREPDGSDVLIAGVSMTPGAPFDAASLRAALASHLPAPAVPSALYALDESAVRQVTGSGKLDRREIRAAVSLIHQHAHPEKESVRDRPER